MVIARIVKHKKSGSLSRFFNITTVSLSLQITGKLVNYQKNYELRE